MRAGITLGLLLLLPPLAAQNKALFPDTLGRGPLPCSWLAKARRAADRGDFQGARRLLLPHLGGSGSLGWAARWEVERMRRVALDFQVSPTDMLTRIRKRRPAVTESQMAAWRRKGHLRALSIDGELHYFNRALRTLAILAPRPPNPHPGSPSPIPPATPAQSLARRNLTAAGDGTERYVAPTRLRIDYRLTVKEGAVPPGARLRCWLPFARPSARQREIRLLSTSPPNPLVAPESAPQRTVYLEQIMPAKSGATFEVSFSYLALASVVDLKPERAQPLSDAERKGPLAPWLTPRAPHVAFTLAVANLAAKLEDPNPLITARRIFTWMQKNIPWAPAREYSTIRCIPDLVLKQRHGDCGMQSLLMISLLRACGIPARWQSGWSVQPRTNTGMHDWLRLYIKPWGWIHADPSRGWIAAADARTKWFNLGSLDQYRLTVCDDWGTPLHPAKVHFRAEPVDFQRGEVEWEGGGLYFDQFTRRITVTEVAR